MKIIRPSIRIIGANQSKQDFVNVLKNIENVARTCYKSERRIDDESYAPFIRKLIANKHEAMLEFGDITVRIICDRGVSHELVRHRLASYAQESTRYCNYSKNKFGNELTFILPCFADDEELFEVWKESMLSAERNYIRMCELSAPAQVARSVLPNSTKTEINVKMNFREWRHFLKLRTAKNAHPDMQIIANMIKDEFKELVPIVFDDIE